jgi:hypothetical protein
MILRRGCTSFYEGINETKNDDPFIFCITVLLRQVTFLTERNFKSFNPILDTTEVTDLTGTWFTSRTEKTNHQQSFQKQQQLQMKDKVCIIGSGNWGSAIATIVGPNVIQHSAFFEPIVHMWVYEEMVTLPSSLSSSSRSVSSSPPLNQDIIKTNKYKLTEVINSYHENVKYLPNIRLPHNIVATSSIETACCDATLLIFVLPHQFLNQKLLSQICHSRLSPSRCRAISLIKGIGTFSLYPLVVQVLLYIFDPSLSFFHTRF